MISRATVAAWTALTFFGCEYIEPPTVDLEFPPEGTFVEGDALRIVFSEPVVDSSIRVRVWPDVRDPEGDLPPSAEPLLDVCTVVTSPCGDEGTTLTIVDDGSAALLQLNPTGIGRPDVPLLLEVLAGTESIETGADIGRDRLFDFQFKPAVVVQDPVPFEEGVYLFVSVFDEPIPNVITLMSDVRTNDAGVFWIIGAEADEIDGAAQNTRDPTELYIDTEDTGFVAFAEGTIRENDIGERFVETDRFGIDLQIGPLLIEILGLRFTGIVVKNEETGLDQIQGTLSFENIRLTSDGGQPFVYDAGTTTFVADQVPDDLIPPGTPEMCDDPCGDVPSQCNIPAPWPPPGFCGVPLDVPEGSGEGAIEGSGHGAN